MTIRVGAPGKTILMGEHAAVYGHPALVAAVDRRVTAELGPVDAAGAENGTWLDLPDTGVREWMPWSALHSYADRCRQAWQAWSVAEGAGDLEAVMGSDPAHVVKVAVGEALTAASDAGTLPHGGLRDRNDAIPSANLRVQSQLPVGSGFGSSAAVGVAVLAAICEWIGTASDAARLEELAFEVERRQHGSPSGIDGATVIRGGVLFFERESGRLRASPVGSSGAGRACPAFGAEWQLYQSGEPESATGEVVAHVRRLRARDSAAFDREMEKAVRSTLELRRQIESGSPAPREVIRSIRGFESWLEGLGVVPEPVRRRIRAIESAGGAAKISGAGACRGVGAGSILVYHPEPATLPAETLTDWHCLDSGLGATGLEIRRARANDASPNIQP